MHVNSYRYARRTNGVCGVRNLVVGCAQNVLAIGQGYGRIDLTDVNNEIIFVRAISQRRGAERLRKFRSSREFSRQMRNEHLERGGTV